MQLKIGDRVSFINERRDGIVRKIINSTTVSVEIEDGFEVPILVNELIKLNVTSETTIPLHISQDNDISQERGPDGKADTTDKEKVSEETNPVTPLLKDNNIYKEVLFLAFEPLNQNEFLSDGFNLYFINHTVYNVLFSCYLKKNDNFNGICYDAVSPMSKYHIKTLNNEQLSDWSTLLFHCIFYSDEMSDIKQPLVKELTINAVKFFKQNSFVFTSMTGSKCLLFPFYDEVTSEAWEEEEWINEKINPISVRNIKEMTQGNFDMRQLDKKHIVAPYIAEVDLHIEQLIDNDKNLGNHEKLNIQLAYFSKCLDAAIVHKFKKITFIHGVGQGRLKEEIHKVIKESYPGVKIQDAPFKKFGMGATEVLIPFNLTL